MAEPNLSPSPGIAKIKGPEDDRLNSISYPASDHGRKSDGEDPRILLGACKERGAFLFGLRNMVFSAEEKKEHPASEIQKNPIRDYFYRKIIHSSDIEEGLRSLSREEAGALIAKVRNPDL